MISVDDLFNVVRFRDAYGVDIQTPNIDRLLAMGTYFDAAYALVPACNPSRAATLTGLSQYHNGLHHNPDVFYEMIDPTLTLPYLLRQNGYYTTGVGKNFHGDMNAVETDAARLAFFDTIFDHYQLTRGDSLGDSDDGLVAAVGPGTLAEDQLADTNAALWASSFIADPGTDQPWFLALGLMKPHLNWHVPQAYYDLYDPSGIVVPETPADDYDDVPDFFVQFLRSLFGNHQKMLDADQWVAGVHSYLAAVSYADAQLGRVLDAMDAAGAWDTTSVVLWSDHGFHLGDKSTWGKFTHWEQAANAPVIVVDPDFGTPGSVVTDPVSLLDLFPTILDLVGLEDDGSRDGSSLLPLITDPGARGGTVAITMFDGSISLRTAEWRYIVSLDGSEQLYDIVADPNQFDNLADEPSLAGAMRALRRLAESKAADLGVTVDFRDAILRGNGEAQHFWLTPNVEKVAGGNGIDTYHLYDAADLSRIVEHAGGGRGDKVWLYGDGTGGVIEVTLPDQIEDFEFSGDNALHLTGSDRGDSVLGAARGDLVLGLKGADRIDGNSGNDSLFGGYGSDFLIGGHGNDLLGGGMGRDTLRGGTGNDLLRGNDGDDVLTAGDGDDQALGGLGNDVVLGDAGNDRLAGEEGNDRMLGGDGQDTMTGDDGDDRLEGNAGQDLISGGTGDDQIFGGADADTLHGDSGNDTILAGTQGDSVHGGSGDDLIRGDDGNDLAHGEDGDDTLWGGEGDDTLWGDAGGDRLEGERGADRLSGGDGADFLHGGNSTDTLSGDAGNDTLWGGGEDDWLSGGAGDDLIMGGAGADCLEGGAGRDLFQFNLQSGDDVIADFRAGLDRVEIGGVTGFAALIWTETAEGVRMQDASHRFSVLFEGLDRGDIDAGDFIF